MKFEIKRTSLYDDTQPCEEATREKYTRIDCRSVDDPAKIPAHKGQDTSWWYSEGVNHRVEDGCIKRDFPDDDERWVIEIGSLEELLAFSDKYGNLVLCRSWQDGERSIEIYDDYRE